ncbi:hypothetical protein LJ756_14135 [Arthrobacter sp. zg-Y411]|uniref:hypothetical protein n=1 Tax=Arthrobacter zhangbolii TaxID=2886936 RepID=UPI001D157C61|nr:hypothetical protein [Arthrobacter zhangbolii]MCC3295756.1 hypothetical protein [Arthrobacter zhangbolii]
MRKDDDLQALPEHLREDISAASAPEMQDDDEHLEQDINLPAGEKVSGPEFDSRHYTAGQLNAGAQVAGLSPDGEYAKSREEELES